MEFKNPLREENYRQKIESMTAGDWKPLLDLIPEIEKTETFYIPGEISYPDEYTLIIGQSTQSSVVYRFTEIVYQIQIIIDFNWGSWNEGRKLISNPDTDIDAIDIPTLCKLITAIVRNDRFCEGALAARFEDGTILKILTSIQSRV